MDNNLIFGIRPVVEAIEAGREIEKLYIRKGAEGQLMTELRDLCLRHRVRVQEVPVEKLNRLVRGNHQGVVAQIAAIAYVQLDDILERVPDDETPLVVVFDGVTDVRNFGAIARSAECAGAHGLIAPLKNSAPVNAEAIRASAGALTTIPVCRVGSIRNTLKTLQAEGFQVVAATEKSRKLLYDADLRRPTALVMGAEETGISKEVLKLCDERLAIPLIGRIESLNVSAAAAVMLFEVVRQRIGAATE
ncbi:MULTISPECIES: 23S rRNA (guanosine(2251)-2'-O)-methyltransferase RlmB [Alistipes]|jgi:RNA methyltransferase, trmH family, group 3|uniref:23S rRNA (Guanosine(2251)-2'-O)-methyltransferase RlmB n=1 Tax=Alistipes communis TaxID=2585118 RepID=A0A4Y1XLI1_9BACT|nr:MULTISPECIES: 23S rRNA (guanosine(2251)-2'-O)-methyltransferase RlmB [Alistipes]MBS5555117.1 23S rRNA (guanosine(2251)-2'-O)-methyltransferase RlmB [Alistipes sp.]BBL04642.1 23S rRNA (guanosine(2251)-2'-O)-methyltransferase RlmB [Alistipes communis]BBL14161.1 23S rRNA (guanosine(2251)-2'-O)-methyltransferase RlmB [Alistipes communis]